MRAAFVEAMKAAIPRDDRVILLLGDIGVHAMRDIEPRDRVLNLGIREQCIVNVAAGLATQGFYPIVHTIEPFLCERALEQIKLFAYNGLKGMFVTVGGSYDYSGLGCTHHCPAGPGNMLTIPGMQVNVPSHPDGVLECMLGALETRALSYVRLIDAEFRTSIGGCYHSVGDHPDRPILVTTGTTDRLVTKDIKRSLHIHLTRLDVASSTIERFLSQSGIVLLPASKIVLVEEWYRGVLTKAVTEAFFPRPTIIQHVGVTRKFLTEYGTKAEMEARIGLTTANLAMAMEMLHHA